MSEWRLLQFRALGGIGLAVALDVEDTVVDELAGRLQILNVVFFAVHNLQFGDRFAFHHDADTLRGCRLIIVIAFLNHAAYAAAEEASVRTDGGAGRGVRAVNHVVLQTEVGVSAGIVVQRACAERAYHADTAATRIVVVACEGGYVAIVGIGVDGHVREDERGLLRQFGVGIDDITLSRLEGLRPDSWYNL